MAEGLSNAQVIGGVVVTIGADLTGLRAGEREAKAIATNIERTVKVNLPVLFDASRLSAQVPQLAATANAIVRSMPPIRIPVMLDLSGMVAQLAAVRGMMGGGGFGIPTVTSGAAFGGGGMPPLLLPGAAGAAGGGGPLFSPGRGWAFGSGSPSPSATARITGGGTTQTTAIGPAGTVNIPGVNAAGANGGGAGALGAANSFNRSIRATLIGAAIARGAGAAIQTGFDLRSQSAAFDRGDVDAEVAAQQRREQTLRSVGILGSGELAVGIRDLLSGTGTARGNDRAYIEDITAQTAIQEKRSAIMAARASAGRTNMVSAQGDTRRIGLANSLAFSTSGESGVASAAFALSEFNRQQADFRQSNGLKADSADVMANRAALEQSLRIAGTQQGIERAAFGGRIQAATAGASLGISGIRAYYAGDTEAAAKAERDAQRVGIVQGQAEAVLSAPDSQKAGMRRANKAELQLFDEQSAKESYDRQKQRAADLTQTIGAKQAASLAISKQYFQAELAAFDAKTKAEIGLIDDKAARQNATERAAAQRSVMVAQEQQRVGQAVRLSSAGATGSNLRIAHRGDEAALVEFDARAKETLSGIANPQERAAKQRELDAQRRELVNQQGEDKTNRSAGYSTRTAQAQAFDRYGMYQSGVAGIIGQIAGYKAELRNAPAGDVQQIRSTQVAELEGMQKRIIGASAGQYAQAFDPRYDAARPNGGADEQLKELRLIREYLRQLAGMGSGGTPAVP